jgi:DNA-binding NarL/FixJ family response regulator
MLGLVSVSAGRAALRVMLVEDHGLVRAAVRRTLSVQGIQIVEEATTAEEALDKVMACKPEVMLVDLDLPGMSGIQLVREVAPRLPATQMVMLAGSARPTDVVAAMRAGAAGYLLKDLAPDALVRAIRGIRVGEMPMPRRLVTQLVKQLVERHGPNGNDSGLSSREVEVLQLVSDGLTDREVGAALGISPRTVGRHVGSILAKLGARNRADAARRYRGGL